MEENKEFPGGFDPANFDWLAFKDDRLQKLAELLGCLSEEDLCILCDIEPSAAEAWRKRHKGPRYSLVGNRVLYPRMEVEAFIGRQVRGWPDPAPPL